MEDFQLVLVRKKFCTLLRRFHNIRLLCVKMSLPSFYLCYLFNVRTEKLHTHLANSLQLSIVTVSSLCKNVKCNNLYAVQSVVYLKRDLRKWTFDMSMWEIDHSYWMIHVSFLLEEWFIIRFDLLFLYRSLRADLHIKLIWYLANKPTQKVTLCKH